jgi:trehalose synthase
LSTGSRLAKPSLEEYKPIVGEKKIEEIRFLAEKLQGRKVCHVNSTSYGGGVAELLSRLVPLMRAVGLEADWHVIKGSDEFFQITKTIHNGLQGMPVRLTDEMKKTYLLFNERNAKDLELHHDFIVIHDPQPAPLISYYQRLGKWIWRCHVDLSSPNKETMDFITSFIVQYDAQIFSMKKYVPDILKERNVSIMPPCIDPFSPKNMELQDGSILSILDKYDVKTERPIIAQVGRFDPWKDPLGAIDVYNLVKKKLPQVQLLLVGIMAPDDPEGWRYYEQAARYAGNDYDIHLLTDLVGVHDIEVNAFQRASNVVLQMSKREGFGLTVAEAMWKRVPVIGRDAGGIHLQILNGETGFLVDTVQEAAEKVLYVLEHPGEAKLMGEKGRDHIAQNFLITRYLEDYLRLFGKL